MHTEQYLKFTSHDPLHQKLGVLRTLFNRCDNVVTQEKDHKQEKEYITGTLKQCNYLAWSIHKARKDMQDKSDKEPRKLVRKRSQ